ncbi:hypothetical protein H4582DRAFT_1202088 [Lactarius indigo]|nr:hypothetical protein H4582DRAFT_1202088 [Lactarius indigo]
MRTDDEIGPGCHILVFATPGIGRSKLWIRKDYTRLYNFCDFHRNGEASFSCHYRTTRLLGPLCMHRCLAETKPVIWPRLLLFVPEVVYQASSASSPPSPRPLFGCWSTLTSRTGTSPHLIVDDTKHFIIFSTSSKSYRWELLKKTTDQTVYTMNSWTRKVTRKAAFTHRFADGDKRIHDIYDQAGPTRSNSLTQSSAWIRCRIPFS